MIEIYGIPLPFTHQSGSKVWPSDDKDDSPFDKYVCDQCGYEYNYQAYGLFYMKPGDSIDEFTNNRAKELREVLLWHATNCPKSKRCAK